jgi:hypothetical protein
VFALDANIAGEFAQKSRADAAPENKSENNNCDTDDDEKFSHLGHDSILVSDPVVSSGVVLLVGATSCKLRTRILSSRAQARDRADGRCSLAARSTQQELRTRTPQ